MFKLFGFWSSGFIWYLEFGGWNFRNSRGVPLRAASESVTPTLPLPHRWGGKVTGQGGSDVLEVGCGP
jgi:hypothetical protein